MNRFSIAVAGLLLSCGVAAAADAQCQTVKDKVKRARCECVTDNGGTAWANPTGGVQWGRVPRTMTGQVSACMARKGYPA